MYQDDVFKYLEEQKYRASSFNRVLKLIFFLSLVSAIVWIFYNKKKNETIIKENKLKNKIYIKPYLINEHLSYDIKKNNFIFENISNNYSIWIMKDVVYNNEYKTIQNLGNKYYLTNDLQLNINPNKSKWKISKINNYYTIRDEYNKYLVLDNKKKQINLNDNITDYSKWVFFIIG
jgi:hypothetical protein